MEELIREIDRLIYSKFNQHFELKNLIPPKFSPNLSSPRFIERKHKDQVLRLVRVRLQFITNEIFVKNNFQIFAECSKNQHFKPKNDSKDFETEKRGNGACSDAKRLRRSEVEATANYEMALEFDRSINAGSFTCEICFERMPQTDIIELECGHDKICRNCMFGYLRTKIGDADVQNIACPMNNCETPISRNSLELIIGPDLIRKYDDFMLKIAVSDMQDVVNCPKDKCNRLISAEADLCLAHCPFCNYDFCTSCFQPYHGSTDCGLTDEQRKQLLEVFKVQRRAEIEAELEQRRRRLIEEDEASKRLIRSDTRLCPYCFADIYKIDGCNNVTCGRCHRQFQYNIAARSIRDW